MKNYYVFTIISKPFLPEILSSLLWELPITGLTEEADSVKIFSNTENFIDEIEISSLLEKLVNEKLINSFIITKEVIENKNWNELWEKGRDIIRVSNRIVIKPTFKGYSPNKNEIVLTIDPKMSFGTGEHQTTKLVLRLLEKIVTTGIKVLDVGAGTGILAIAAVKLGASKAVAVDFDEVCYENCLENCSLNDVSDNVEILTGSIDDVYEDKFDIVFANIHKNVLLEIADKIKSKLAENRKVILSGLLKDDQSVIEKKYHSTGFSTEMIETMDDWIAIVLKV
jgi:ribosomal protein L11 methyltransferase